MGGLIGIEKMDVSWSFLTMTVNLVTKARCKDLPASGRGDFRCRRAVNSSSFC